MTRTARHFLVFLLASLLMVVSACPGDEIQDDDIGGDDDTTGGDDDSVGDDDDSAADDDDSAADDDE